MDHCNYHPLSPAIYQCDNCDTSNCERCVDEGEHGAESLCFQCNSEMIFLGRTESELPFWRRLKESFEYPIHTQVVVFIVGVSVLMSISSYLPLAIIWLVLLQGSVLKYCFSSLQSTAYGQLQPPDITEAYGGGWKILLSLILVILFYGLLVGLVAAWLSESIASIFAVLLVALAPAIIINYAMSERLSAALNPLAAFGLMTSIGLPYGLLLAFILIMVGSVEVITSTLGSTSGVLLAAVQSMVAIYYAIVMFHLMGYIIYQYQDKLGFVTEDVDRANRSARSARERCLAKISILLKEGQYDQVLKLFSQAIKEHPDDTVLLGKCFDFLSATGNREQLVVLSHRYLNLLAKLGRKDQLNVAYRRVLDVSPDYVPNNPGSRHMLAEWAHDRGDYVGCIKLVGGMHKLFADYEQLVEANELMAQAFEAIPGREKYAAQSRLLADKLRKKRVRETAAANSTGAEGSSEAVANSDVTASVANGEKPPLNFA